MDKNIIRERLRYATLTLTTSAQNFFTSDIPEKIVRYIVAIFIVGDGSASTTIDISRVNEDDTSTIFLPDIPIAPAELKQIPQNYSVEDPVITLEGGTNLSAVASAGSPKVTIIYWDDEL